jgi:hypothetical protein
METYIIRIYRRPPDGSEPIVGTFECVETGVKKQFVNYNQLKEIIVGLESSPKLSKVFP